MVFNSIVTMFSNNLITAEYQQTNLSNSAFAIWINLFISPSQYTVFGMSTKLIHLL